MDTRLDGNVTLVESVPRIRPVANPYFVRGVSPAMRALERAIADIAPTDIPVLLVGESGTGKDAAALEIHRLSSRRNEQFMKCGCGGLTAESLAARLHCGQTGAEHETAGSGSLFLDEISHLDLASQARLLDLLPDGGGAAPENCLSARIISSTTRNIEEEMHKGRFREELYYRINGVILRLPPLRQRREDIPELLEFFLNKYASLFGRPKPQTRPAAMDLLLGHSWPGNIRELENVARKIVVLGNDELAIANLSVEDAPRKTASAVASPAGNRQAPGQSLKAASREASRHAEREMILKQLERTHWNRKRTARDLQISYKALLYKLKQMGLTQSDNSDGQ